MTKFYQQLRNFQCLPPKYSQDKLLFCPKQQKLCVLSAKSSPNFHYWAMPQALGKYIDLLVLQMNNQKKIISIFKLFIEKMLIPQIRKIEGSLQQWYQFSVMFNVQYPNLNQIQTFVDRLPDPKSLLKIRSDNSAKKKDQPQSLFPEEIDRSGKNGFNSNRSFGGDRSKNPFQNSKGFEMQEAKQVRSEPKDGSYVKDEQFKKIALNTVPNIQKSNSSNSIINSLNRIYMNLLDNQKRFDSLSPVNAQNRG